MEDQQQYLNLNILSNVEQSYFLPAYFKDKWNQMKPKLNQTINTGEELEQVIQQIKEISRTKFKQKFNQKYDSLHIAIKKFEKYTKTNFIKDLLPKIQKQALESQTLFEKMNHQIPTLQRNRGNQKLVLTQQQNLSLNCLAFLDCLIPLEDQKQFGDRKLGEYTFHEVMKQQKYVSEGAERTVCLLYYFFIMFQQNTNESVIYYRTELTQEQTPDWQNIDEPCDTVVDINLAGLEESKAFYQVDFANKNLSLHCIIPSLTQEEVIFSIRPDCYPSLIMSDTLQPNEAFFIHNAPFYSKYSGYLESFRFEGKSDYMNSNDIPCIIAIDALAGPGRFQFSKNGFDRDLNKALIGFKGVQESEESSEQKQLNRNLISTGNWGCGAFGGDFYMKFIQQLMAAKMAGKSLQYSTFKNQIQKKDYDLIYKHIIEKKITVAQLYKLVLGYYEASSMQANFYFRQYCIDVLVKGQSRNLIGFFDKVEDKMIKELEDEQIEQERQQENKEF